MINASVRRKPGLRSMFAACPGLCSVAWWPNDSCQQAQPVSRTIAPVVAPSGAQSRRGSWITPESRTSSRMLTGT